MRRRDVLRALGLGAGASAPGVAVAQTPDCTEALRRRYDEFHLASHRLPSGFYENALLFDAKHGVWARQPAGHVVVRGRVVVLHLWADYCAPCRAEFPWLSELVKETERNYKGLVQFLFVSETQSSEAMQHFVDRYAAILPQGPHYLDTENRLFRTLSQQVPSGALSLPTTLLCDPLVLRQGLCGPLWGRRAELRVAIERLLRLASPSFFQNP